MSTQTADHYLSTAFYSQYNLILLGGSALFALASASPVPLAIGVAAEALWLGVGRRLPAFRRRVDERLESERRALLDDQVSQGMRGLSAEHTSRLLALGQSISWLSVRARGDALERAALLELETLRPAFMRLCLLRERAQQRLDELRASPPEHEVAELARAYSAEKDLGLRFTLHQAIKSAHKKVEQQATLHDVQRQVELKLSLVEQAVSNLRSQQQLGLSGADLAREIQAAVSQVVLVPALEGELDGHV